MKIEIDFLPTDKNLDSLKAFMLNLETKHVPEPLTESACVTEQPCFEQTTLLEQVQAAEAEKPASKITKSDVRAEALKLSKAGKQDDLAKCFASFGHKKLSDFSETEYPALLAALKEVAQ